MTSNCMSLKPHQLNRLATLVDYILMTGLLTSTCTIIFAPSNPFPNISQAIATFCTSVKSYVRNLGVIFDSIFGFDSHIKSTCFNHLRNISKIRPCIIIIDHLQSKKKA